MAKATPVAFVFPGDAAMAFADAGGVIEVTVEWIPNPDIIERHLMQAAGHFDDLAKPLLASKAIARADMQKHFDTETAPDGSAWTPLDPDYLATKVGQGFDPRILHRKGPLEKAATSFSAFVVTGHDLFFHIDEPLYWQWMNDGTDSGGFAGMAHEMRERTKYNRSVGHTDESGAYAHDSMGIGRGKATPARPFVGISAEAEDQIIEVFDLWFAEGFNIAISGSGTVQTLNNGKFGGKIYPRF